jgi:hypothetical protein
MRLSNFLFTWEKRLSQAIKRQAMPVVEHLFAAWLVHQEASLVLAVLVLLAAMQFRRT